MAPFEGEILAAVMQAIQSVLFTEIIEKMQRELGREETLRLIWPAVVGPQLAMNTRLKAARGTTLVVAVPDRTWRSSMGVFENMILSAANRLSKRPVWEAVEFVEEMTGFEYPKKLPKRAKVLQSSGLEKFAAESIENEELREMFVNSARKYFSRGSAKSGDGRRVEGD